MSRSAESNSQVRGYYLREELQEFLSARREYYEERLKNAAPEAGTQRLEAALSEIKIISLRFGVAA